MVIVFLAVGACSTSPISSPKPNPHYKIGSPYEIDGRWYYPQEDPTYDQVGLASWYGSQFQGKPTANGEIFDKARLSAAHKTLPLPSLVEVHNLENGRSAILRVNDRGPFVDDRIIDLSQAAATMLGFENKGLAKVRVRYVEPAELAAVAPKPGKGKTQKAKRQFAGNRQFPPPNPSPVQQGVGGIEPQPAFVPGAGQPRPEFTRSQTGSAGHQAIGTTDISSSAPIGQTADSQLATSLGHIWLEIDGFFDLDVAEAAKASLADIGPARLESRSDPMGTVHTLFFGPYSDQITAQAWLAAVIDAGYARARLKETPRSH